MHRPTIARALILAGLLGLAATPAVAQLCSPTANPCVLSSSLNVASGSIFDLGTRDLVIAANQTLTVLGAGIMTITARNVTLDDGARIVANGGSTGMGGDVVLLMTGGLTLDPSSRIDVSGGAGGSLLVIASSVVMNGQIRAIGTLRDNDGGLISIQTTGNVSVGGTGILGSSGNRFGCGGLFEIIADGSVTVSSPIEFRGGDCDGGDIDIDALGDISIAAAAQLNVIATYEFGSGGAIGLTAGGNVTVSGTVVANGEGSFTEGAGDGGDLDIIGHDVTVGGQVSLNGGSPDGSGGFMDLTATGRIQLNQAISIAGTAQGIGGDLLLAADGNIELNHTVNATAGFIGGSRDAFTGATFLMNAAAFVDMSGTGSPFGQFGGTIDVQACNVTVPLGADLLATGPGPTPRASIRLLASNLMTIGGTVNAGAVVELYYRSVPPVFTPGFVISPAPVITADPSLPCCVACSGTTTSTTSSTTSSSSSTTINGPTTTAVSSSTSTSTSSTTIPGPCGTPMTGCRTSVQPFRTSLVLKDKSTDDGDKLVWKWLRGSSTTAGDFGNPLGTDNYVLCIWSGLTSPTLIARVDAPAGGTCDGKACWRSTGRGTPTGFKYVDSDLTPNGAQKVILGAGVARKAKAIVKAKGVSLALPSLPATLPLRVQLQGGPGRCFEAFYTSTGLARNDATTFEGRGSFPNTTTTTSTSTTSTTSPIPICGNGAREFPEQCDDGNLVNGDCCSSICMGEPLGSPCAEDGNVCTLDVCSGLGVCFHPPGHPGTVCRPAADVCDASEQCSGVTTACPPDLPLPNGTSCESDECLLGESCQDGTCAGGTPLACGACEGCDPELGCVPEPAQVCRHGILPEKSTILLKNRIPDTSDKLVWKWARGEETAPLDFGTPNLDDGYALCLYDESTFSPVLAAVLEAPAGGTCGTNACWRPASGGYKYVDPLLTPDGTQRLILKAGPSGKAAMTFKAKGANIPMPALPLGSVLRLQLRGNGDCWEATFSASGITQNDAAGLKARSD